MVLFALSMLYGRFFFACIRPSYPPFLPVLQFTRASASEMCPGTEIGRRLPELLFCILLPLNTGQLGADALLDGGEIRLCQAGGLQHLGIVHRTVK